MIRVCFLLPQTYIYFNENVKGKGGGAEKIAYILSSELAKDPQFDIHFCVADYGQPEIETINNVIIHNAYSNRGNKFKAFLRLLKLIKKTKADVYIYAGSGAAVGAANIATNLLLRKKTVYMLVHDSEISFGESRKIIGFWGAFLMGIAYKLNTAITAQSEYQKHLFEQNRKIKVKDILRNIIDLSGIESNEDQNRNKMIWVCRCERWKQPEMYIELAKKFSTEEFIMVCSLSSDREYWHEIKQKALAVKNIVFYDYMPNSELAKQYKSVKLFVNTSTAEGFSFAMMEAMATGCAVLTYNTNPDSFIDKHQIGFCANGVLNDFYDNFQSLSTSKETLLKMSKNARKYLEDYHSVPQIINKFKDIVFQTID